MPKPHKRVKTVLALIAVLAVLLAVFVCDILCNKVALADESKSEEEVRKELSEAVNDAIDRLDLSDFQKFIDSLGEQEKNALNITDAKATLKALVNGQANDFFDRLLNLLAGTLGKYFAGFLPSFITIIVICLLKDRKSVV